MLLQKPFLERVLFVCKSWMDEKAFCNFDVVTDTLRVILHEAEMAFKITLKLFDTTTATAAISSENPQPGSKAYLQADGAAWLHSIRQHLPDERAPGHCSASVTIRKLVTNKLRGFDDVCARGWDTHPYGETHLATYVRLPFDR